MHGTPPHIRPMTLADCDRVSEIRVRGWQHAYRGFVPQGYLDGLSVAEDAHGRRAGFASYVARGTVNLVAERDGQVVGWAAHGPHRDGEALTGDAELFTLYVDTAHQGSGVGRALLDASLAQRRAHPRMVLWVLKENAPARRFYERAGFHADGAEESFKVHGVAVPEVRYTYTSGIRGA